jgi:hypothetical protein
MIGKYVRWIKGTSKQTIIDVINAHDMKLQSIREISGHLLVKVTCERSTIYAVDEWFKSRGYICRNRRPYGISPPAETRRSRGHNFERWIVSFFNHKGFVSERVPLSGALKNYPGDVIVTLPNDPGDVIVIEAKMTTKAKSIQIKSEALDAMQEGKTNVVIFRQGAPDRVFAIVPLEKGKISFLQYLHFITTPIPEQPPEQDHKAYKAASTTTHMTLKTLLKQNTFIAITMTILGISIGRIFDTFEIIVLCAMISLCFLFLLTRRRVQWRL